MAKVVTSSPPPGLLLATAGGNLNYDSASPALVKTKPQTYTHSTLNWVTTKFSSLTHGIPTSILPGNTRASATAAAATAALQEPARSLVATKSFEEAVKNCREKVEKISQACRRENRRYRDAHFDCGINDDFCLNGLLGREDDSEPSPAASPRICDIFEDPVFFKEGATAGDVEQGSEGDCWFIAAVATVTNVKGLLEKICVARDEEVGVYGFVFMRDGEWSSVIIDDQLYTRYHPQLDDENPMTRYYFEGKEREYEKTFVKGSKCLYFAKCHDQNETWLPLLEKAYAKFHGDYGALYGGYAGEAIEDLTGGVTTETLSKDILDKTKFWEEGLMTVNDQCLFAAWTCQAFGARDTTTKRQGIIKNHSYSVLRAVEIKGEKFVLLRNPWGKKEWKGPWSDGSKEWTPEWMSLLSHSFGNDGKFWMSYRDFLKKFDIIEKTRLFDKQWSVTESRWVNYKVPWSADYADTRFEVSVTKETPVVLVLSQLDGRFFMGLEGRFDFKLTFRLHKEGEEDYITKSAPNVLMSRSVSSELDLQPGKYTVLFSVEAELRPTRYAMKDIVRRHEVINRQKFKQIAMNADLAHAKAGSTSFWREADEELMREASATLGDAPPLPPLDLNPTPLPDGEGSRPPSPGPPAQPPIQPPPADSQANFEWKARVCVGLRVYSKDPELTVELVTPKEDKNEDVVDLDNPTKDLNPKDAKETGDEVKCTCGKEKETVQDPCNCGKDAAEKEQKAQDKKGKEAKPKEPEVKKENDKGKGCIEKKKTGEGVDGHEVVPYCPKCNPCPRHDIRTGEQAASKPPKDKSEVPHTSAGDAVEAGKVVNAKEGKSQESVPSEHQQGSEEDDEDSFVDASADRIAVGEGKCKTGSETANEVESQSRAAGRPPSTGNGETTLVKEVPVTAEENASEDVESHSRCTTDVQKH